MTTTRTIYQKALVLDGKLLESHRDLPPNRGDACATMELASRTRLLADHPAEDIVIVRVDERQGADGCWHFVSETIVEWGVI